MRNHWSPKISSNVPMNRRRLSIGITDNAGPSAAITTARQASAAPVPISADRHPRDANGQHDGQRLDHLDRARQERGEYEEKIVGHSGFTLLTKRLTVP